jgi:hypothetical protein
MGIAVPAAVEPATKLKPAKEVSEPEKPKAEKVTKLAKKEK